MGIYVICMTFLGILVGLANGAENISSGSGLILTSGDFYYGESSLMFLDTKWTGDPKKKEFKDRMLDSCDVDIQNKMIYMFDMRHRQIVVGNNFDEEFKKEDMEFTSVRSVVASTGVKIAVDWVSHNVYWTDSAMQAVLMQPGGQNIDRSLYRIIIQEHLEKPYGLALDPLSGLLFWVDAAAPSFKFKIERSSLSGKNRKAVFATSISRLYAITADVIQKRIYFTKDDYIESANYDGGERMHIPIWSKTVYIKGGGFYDIGLAEGSVFAVDREGIFVTDRLGHLHGGPRPLNNAKGICVFDRNKQRSTQDPCASAACEDMCVSEQGKAVCLCRSGFNLQPDGFSCEEVAGDYHRAILLNNGTHLCLLSIHILSDYQQNALGCFYEHQNDSELMLYVDMKMESREVFFATETNIYRVPMNMYTREAEHVTEMFVDNDEQGRITGLSYDWVTDHLYWSQNGPDGIFFINPDTSYFLPVKLTNKTSFPRELIVVPHAGNGSQLFWISTLGSDTLIQTTNLSGGSETNIAVASKDELHSLVRLQHDVKNEQLVVLRQWDTSRGTTTDVLYVNYTGTTQQNFAIYVHVCNFVLYKDLLLLVGEDDNNDTILYSRNRFAYPTGESLTSLGSIDLLGSVESLKVIDVDTLQPQYRNPCGVVGSQTASCNQICVPQGNSAQCFCDVGYSLMEDAKTCYSAPVKDDFILVTDDTHGKLYQFPLDSSDDIRGVKTSHPGRLRSILYNEVTNMVIWAEYSYQIWSSSLDGKHKSLVADTDLFRAYPSTFALDSTSGYVYFVGDTEPSKEGGRSSCIIGVIFPGGESTIVHKEGERTCFDIVLYPSKGLMFWTDTTPRLVRTGMDGSDVETLASGGRLYWRLTIDYSEEHIYWSEYSKSTIYRSNLEGKDVKEFYSVISGFINQIKLSGHYLYYSGFHSVHINRVNKHNISDVAKFGPNAGIGAIDVFDVYVSNDTLKMPKNKACSQKNGGCSHFCLPRADGGRTCACKYGFTLQADRKTCNGTMCPGNIPNGGLSSSCIPKFGASCDNFTCNEGYERTKDVSLICNESGLWNYDLSMLCIAVDKTRETTILVIGLAAGGGILVVIVSVILVLCILYRKGKILTNLRWSKTSDISSDIQSSLDDSGIGDTSMNYIDHLSWLRTRINQFLILDEDADKAIAAPGDKQR